MDAIFIAAYVGFALVGAFVGRWWVLIVPLAVVPVLYLGTERGWWGHGLGDAWQVGMVLALMFAVVITAAGITFHRNVWRR